MQASISFELVKNVLPDAEWFGECPDAFSGVASLQKALPGDLAFLSHRRDSDQVQSTRATGVIVPSDYDGAPPKGGCGIRVKHPSLAFAQVCEALERTMRTQPPVGLHPAAWADDSAEIDSTASVGPQCLIEAGARIGPGAVLLGQVFVGRNAVVGAGCWVYPQVCIHRDCVLGERVQLHSGVVIGGDGFGYEQTPTGSFKVPQIGNVILGNDVEIGANSCVDRGRVDPTRIGDGTKIDNLVQIAHNVEIGIHCFLCGQAGVAGSTKIGNFVMVGGQVAISDHLEVGDGCMIAGQSGIISSLPPKSKVAGTPAMGIIQQRRLEVLIRRLPELFKRLDAAS